VFVFDDPGVSRRRALAGLAVTVAVAAGAAALWWPRVSTPSRTYSCAYVAMTEADRKAGEEQCRRGAADDADRAALAADVRAAAEQEASRIGRVVHAALCPPARQCPHGAPGPIADADLQRVREALAGETVTDPIVRISRRDDPAPDGTIAYGARLNPEVCVIGYAQEVWARPAGVRTDGRCLAP
jgi:hypothetical protein